MEMKHNKNLGRKETCGETKVASIVNGEDGSPRKWLDV